MARIRTIKPEFWTSAQILECSTNARLLFLGIWNFADDAGRHPWRAKQIKAEIFPADDFSERQVLSWLEELCAQNLIERYNVENKEYFYVTGWKHQRIDKPQPAKYPDPFGEHSTIIPGTFPPDTIRYDTKGKDISCAVASATRTGRNLEFEEFWKAYPKRQGSNPKQPAEKKFKALVKSGIEPRLIIEAAKRYERDEFKLGHIGGPYVAQAVTWLNQRRFFDYEPKQASGPPPGLTEEQQAAWVREQIRKDAENVENAKAKDRSTNGHGGILGTSEGACAPSDYGPR